MDAGRGPSVADLRLADERPLGGLDRGPAFGQPLGQFWLIGVAPGPTGAAVDARPGRRAVGRARSAPSAAVDRRRRRRRHRRRRRRRRRRRSLDPFEPAVPAGFLRPFAATRAAPALLGRRPNPWLGEAVVGRSASRRSGRRCHQPRRSRRLLRRQLRGLRRCEQARSVWAADRPQPRIVSRPWTESLLLRTTLRRGAQRRTVGRMAAAARSSCSISCWAPPIGGPPQHSVEWGTAPRSDIRAETRCRGAGVSPESTGSSSQNQPLAATVRRERGR